MCEINLRQWSVKLEFIKLHLPKPCWFFWVNCILVKLHHKSYLSYFMLHWWSPVVTAKVKSSDKIFFRATVKAASTRLRKFCSCFISSELTLNRIFLSWPSWSRHWKIWKSCIRSSGSESSCQTLTSTTKPTSLPPFSIGFRLNDCLPVFRCSGVFDDYLGNFTFGRLGNLWKFQPISWRKQTLLIGWYNSHDEFQSIRMHYSRVAVIT